MPSDAQHFDSPSTDESPEHADASIDEPGLKQTSVASTISFVFGVGALMTLVLIYPAIIFAGLAICFGHVAKRSLKTSQGELVGWGKARAGKILGYLCLVIALIALVFVGEIRLLVRGAIQSERTGSGAVDQFSPGALGEIEQQLVAGDRTEFGNTDLAAKMAAVFRRELRQSLNRVLTLQGDRGIGLETSGVSCYSHVDKGVCFMAVIPDLRRYNGAAEVMLQKAAWQAAVIALQSNNVDQNQGSPRAVDQDTVHFFKNTSLMVGLMESKRCQTVLWSSDWSDFRGSPSPESIEDDCSKIAGLIGGA